MPFGARDPRRIVKALVQKQHYKALFGMVRTYPEFAGCFARYLFASGRYPYRIPLRTPQGLVKPTLYSHHDMLTVNEVFCRQDYDVRDDVGVVVDIGSNIGLSALFFLTRNSHSKCYLFEPDPANAKKVPSNLAGFEGRYVLNQEAVADQSGLLSFGSEPTGRYGGLGKETDNVIQVKCTHINEILENVLKTERTIDVLKIDTEGTEVAIVKAISKAHLAKINTIYYETNINGEIKRMTPNA